MKRLIFLLALVPFVVGSSDDPSGDMKSKYQPVIQGDTTFNGETVFTDDVFLRADGKRLYFGAGDDCYAEPDGTNLRIFCPGYDPGNGVVVNTNIRTGTRLYPRDPGEMACQSNVPITSGSADNTVHSVSHCIDGNSVVYYSCQSDGADGADSCFIGQHAYAYLNAGSATIVINTINVWEEITGCDSGATGGKWTRSTCALSTDGNLASGEYEVMWTLSGEGAVNAEDYEFAISIDDTIVTEGCSASRTVSTTVHDGVKGGGPCRVTLTHPDTV